MPNITTCTKCGKLYEAFSEEDANAPPPRLCTECFTEMLKGKTAEVKAALMDTDTSNWRYVVTGFDAASEVWQVAGEVKCNIAMASRTVIETILLETMLRLRGSAYSACNGPYKIYSIDLIAVNPTLQRLMSDIEDKRFGQPNYGHDVP